MRQIKRLDNNKIKKVREMEYLLTTSHTGKMYEKESHRLRKHIIEELLLRYKRYFYTSNVLDYGCAEGLYCKFMHDCGYQKIFGCDISTSKIEAARRRYKNKKINFFDLDHFDNRRKYRLIVCTEVLQHVPDYIDTLNLFKKILHKNGYLLISIPNLSKEEKHIFADINNRMSVEELLDQIGGAGFGRQNAIWKFNSELFFKDIQKDFDLIELKTVDTPDGKIKNLWTVGLLRKR